MLEISIITNYSMVIVVTVMVQELLIESSELILMGSLEQLDLSRGLKLIGGYKYEIWTFVKLSPFTDIRRQEAHCSVIEYEPFVLSKVTPSLGIWSIGPRGINT